MFRTRDQHDARPTSNRRMWQYPWWNSDKSAESNIWSNRYAESYLGERVIDLSCVEYSLHTIITDNELVGKFLGNGSMISAFVSVST